jgi:TusE/DsrC/DsvC family sulfur relay protein
VVDKPDSGGGMLNQSEGMEFNSKGYLAVFESWNRDFAIKMAEANDVDLTDCHWIIIDYLRDYFTEYNIPPEPGIIIKNLSKQINPTGPCTRKHLEGLFGQGGCELACKIAGLPGCHCRGV